MKNLFKIDINGKVASNNTQDYEIYYYKVQ